MDSFFLVCYSRVTDLNELEWPDKLSQDDGKYCGGRVSKLVEDERMEMRIAVRALEKNQMKKAPGELVQEVKRGHILKH